MRLRSKVFVGAALFLGALTTIDAADNVSLSVETSRNRLYLGESFILTVRVNGADDATLQPDLSAIKDSRIRNLGSQSQSQHSITFINGRTTRKSFKGRVFQYEVIPSKTGRLAVGPVTLTVGNDTMSDPGPSVIVTGVEKQDWVLIDVELSKPTVLIDESFDVTLRLKMKALSGRFARTDPLAPQQPPELNIPYLNQTIEGLVMPQTQEVLQPLLVNQGNRPGFYINAVTLQHDPFGNIFDFGFDRRPQKAKFSLQRRAITHKNESYWEYTLTTTYTPKDEGAHTFGPVVFKGLIVTAVDDHGRAKTREIFSVGPAAEVRVVAPPEKGRPESYVGVLGSNLTMIAELDTQTCNVGDPLKLTLRITGDVNLEKIRPPPIWNQKDLTRLFKLYEDTLQTQRDSQSVEYSITLRPLEAGTLELPPLEAGFYNTVKGSYETVRTSPVPVRVNEAKILRVGDVVNLAPDPKTDEPGISMAQKKTVPPVTMDIRGASAQPFVPLRAAFPIAVAGPAFFLLSLTVDGLRRLYKRRQRTHGPRHALSNALHIVDEIQRDTHASETERTRRLAVAMRQYVSERFRAGTGTSPDECTEVLKQAGVSEDILAHYHNRLASLVNLAFGGGSITNEEIAQTCGAIQDILKSVDAAVQKGSGNATGKIRMSLLLLSLTLLTVGTQAVNAASGTRNMDFQWRQANHAISTATDREDFEHAADLYRDIIDGGARNGHLYYNHGLALLLAEQYDRAARSFLRAERRLGTTLEIQRGLQLAIAGHEETPVALPWYRIPLFWHYGLPCAFRITALAFAFSCLCIVMTLRRYRRWLWTRSLAVALVCTVAVFGTSVLATVYAEWKAERIDNIERQIVKQVTAENRTDEGGR